MSWNTLSVPIPNVFCSIILNTTMDIQELKEDSDISREANYLLSYLKGIKVIV